MFWLSKKCIEYVNKTIYKIGRGVKKPKMCFGCKTSSILNKGRVFQFAKTRSKWIVSVYVPWLIKKVKRTPIPSTFQQMYRLFMGRPICVSETLKRKRKRKWILVKEITCYKHLQNKTLMRTYDRINSAVCLHLSTPWKWGIWISGWTQCWVAQCTVQCQWKVSCQN